MKKTVSLFVLAALLLESGYAFDRFQVTSVQFSGLAHVSQKTVMTYLPPLSGQIMTPALSDDLLKKLYATGFFSDVELYQKGSSLDIAVVERPTIASIQVTGNQAIKKDAIQKVLQGIGLQTGFFFDPASLGEMVQSLQAEYYMLGKYSVDISPTLKALPRNRIAITVDIAEGTDTKIQRISLVGNHAYPQSLLMKQLTLSTPHLFSFFTKDDVFSQEKLQASLAALRNFYMDRGYLHFLVKSTQVSLDPYKVDSYLTINMSEGGIYHFSGFRFSGETILPLSQLNALVAVKAGALFSRQDILTSCQKITAALGNLGYGFATVDPMVHVNEKTHTVEIQFMIQPGHKTYIQHIRFIGNTVTEDKALRRYLSYQEGGLYNHHAMNQSLMALQRLSYLMTVTPQVQKVPGSVDLANVNYHLKERSSSTITGSLGYSQLDKVMVGLNLGVPNIFGTGKLFSISTQLSKPYKTLNVSYTNPFFTTSGIQQTISAYLTRVDNGEQNLVDFSTNSVGGTLSYSFPLDATDFFNLGGGFDNTQLLQPQNDSSLTVSQFVKDNGNNYNTFSITAGFSRNSTNNAYFPTRGVQASASTQVAVPGSKFTWAKLMGGATWYHALNHTFTFSAGGHVNYGFGYGSTQELPFIDNFYAGGWGSVRGYTDGTMGPQDTLCVTPSGGGACVDEQGQALGGNLEVDGSLNLLFPVPFSDSPNLRFGVFLDAGNAYNTYSSSTVWDPSEQSRYPNFNNLRYSAGISFEWVSPLGPLAFSLGKALNAKPGDSTQPFQFTIGGTF